MSDSLSLVSLAQAPRQRYSAEYKCQVVQESMAPGATIAGVALAHGINTNLLHNWRWQYRRGDFGAAGQGPILLPVRLHAHSPASAAVSRKPAKIIDGPGESAARARIELLFGSARVIVHGVADLSTLRCVIEALRA